MKTLGIVGHSAEGAALCFLTACREGGERLGAFMHPNIVMSAVPMALSMPGWQNNDHAEVAKHVARGVRYVADAGADFFICPDNTAHIVLEQIIDDLPLPALHIAEVVCREIAGRGFKHAALLGTKWTMSGPVYAKALEKYGVQRSIPDDATRAKINDAIFEELCKGVFRPQTTAVFVEAIATLAERGADCAILGCTEIPLIISAENSPLPVLDSTRLLAKYAVLEAIDDRPVAKATGWLEPRRFDPAH